MVVALQASPGQLWMLLLLKINASSPPQFTHDGATSSRKATSFTLGTLSEISFTLGALSGAIKRLSHLVLFWAIEQMMG